MKLAVSIGSIILMQWLCVASGSAADLNHYTGRAYAQPGYLGADEPWSTERERPPRKGKWYFTAPSLPTVNFLVPMRGARTIVPWTSEWYAYCSARWATFNPRTGTVVTPDGIRMCF